MGRMTQAASAPGWQARGREAASPKQIPAKGWRDVLLRIKNRMAKDRLSIIAAGVAFYSLMAIFPALVALVAVYGLAFNPDQVTQQMEAIGGMLPKQAADILMQQLHDLTQTSGT